jgi:hypothetical protein
MGSTWFSRSCDEFILFVIIKLELYFRGFNDQLMINTSTTSPTRSRQDNFNDIKEGNQWR